MKFLFLTYLILAQVVWASEALVTNTHLDVYRKSAELSAKYGARKVLIVLDIDNTLLKAQQPLGSDQWFEWQSEAIKQKTSDAMFSSIDELLEIQADFFQLSHMALTEPNLPEIIQNLKKNGHSIILLTSRAPILRNVTERELLKNKLSFADSSIMKGIPFEFVEAPFKNGVSFMNGIFMTSGHHKGEALDYLIKKSGNRYDAIVFADDHERHTKRVFETFASRGQPEIVTYRYSKEDESVRSFKEGSKSGLRAEALELLRVAGKTFKGR